MTWAVMGGSGFEQFAGFENLRTLARETPFGLASSGLRKVRVAGQELIFLPRHGEHHELTPTEINYRANIFALKKHGATAILSFSAVGSLKAELAPGDLVLATQYIDRTKGLRRHTFCGEGLVGHMSLAYPVCRQASERAFELAKACGLRAHLGGTYVCIEGPNFSTLSESLSYRQLGADVIGMTNFPEYALAREAGLSYLPCAFVTDYDCWDTSRPHVTLGEVITTMRQNNAKAFSLLEKILGRGSEITAGCACADQGLRLGTMNAPEALTSAQREWLKVLTA